MIKNELNQIQEKLKESDIKQQAEFTKLSQNKNNF